MRSFLLGVCRSWQVAVEYATRGASSASLVLKLRTEDFMERGADLSFLSAFPAEREFLYPPLTYLQPTGEVQKLRVDDATFTVVDVEPTFP